MTWTWNGGEAAARTRVRVKAGTRLNDVLARLQLPQSENMRIIDDADWLEVKVWVGLNTYTVWYKLYDRGGNLVHMADHYYFHPAATAFPKSVAWIKDAHIRQLLEVQFAEAQL